MRTKRNTIEDKQSRISEVGEFVHKTFTIDPIIEKSSEPQYHTQIESFILSHARKDVTATLYDFPAIDLGSYSKQNAQENLRKRVSCVKVFNMLAPYRRGDTTNSYDFATHYSYDISGNVKNLVQDFYFMPVTQQRFKRIDYDYDLYSGKVNMVSYNRAMADQFYQRYEYDEDNRIIKAETSPDAIYWDEDANYKYYEHGPLARTGVGDLKIQAVDYAYTIQGWLKAMNGAVIDTAYDMGHDGSRTVYARDLMGLTLDYFKNDYAAIEGTASISQIAEVDYNQNLYNGNITRQNLSLAPLPYLSKQYRYDPLNRISQAKYFDIYKNSGHPLTSIDFYKSKYSYDADGNILGLVRNGNNPAALRMDSMQYQQTPGGTDNKLRNVKDFAINNYNNLDIQYHATTGDRLFYDPIGNLIKDNINGNDTILWNLYGKVREVRNADGTKIQFSYDGAGHRIHKALVKNIDDTTYVQSEYYVRDASGNILSIIKSNDSYNQQLVNIAVQAIPYGNVIANATLNSSLQDYANAAWMSTALLRGSSASPSFTNTMLTNQSASSFLANPNILGALLHTSLDYQTYLYNGQDSLLQKALVADPYNLFDGIAFNKTTYNNAMSSLCTSAENLFAKLRTTMQIPDSLSCSQAATAMGDSVGQNRQRTINITANTFVNDTSISSTEKLTYVKNVMANTSIFNISNEDQQLHWKKPMGEALHKKMLADSSFAVTLQNAFNERGEILPEIISNIDNSQLMALVYNNDPSEFYSSYIAAEGSSGLGAALNRSSMVNMRALANNVGISYTNPAFLQAYENVHLAMDLNLAEHHLYGSSRLGIKGYWPGEIGYIWEKGDPVNHADSASINASKAWYHFNHNEFIKQLAINPIAIASYDSSHWNSRRILGQKQYEFVNHLGNVQMTTLDRLTPINVDDKRVAHDTVLEWVADLSNVYDHYPFGMHMPGRVLGDTSEHCADLTYFQYLPTKVSTTYWGTSNTSTVTNASTLGGFVVVGSGGTLSQYQGSVGLQYNSSAEEFSAGGLSYPVVTSIGQEFLTTFSFSPTNYVGDYCDAQFTAQVIATGSGGEQEILASVLLEGEGTYELLYTAIADEATVRIVALEPNTVFHFTTYSWTVDEISYTQQQVTKTFCSGGENYRFGFNGMEKDNEVKGIGNSLDFGARIYDSRLGRWASLDPMSRRFPDETPYGYAGNCPVSFIDIDGKYRYPAQLAAAYKTQYPLLTTYLANYIQNDITSSQIIMDAMKEYSGGNLTNSQIMAATNWGTGGLLFVFDPGLLGLGNKPSAFGFTYSENSTELVNYRRVFQPEIHISANFAKRVEDILRTAATITEKEAALYEFFAVVTHETVHHFDQMDMGNMWLEPGNTKSFRDEPGAAFMADVFEWYYNPSGTMINTQTGLITQIESSQTYKSVHGDSKSLVQNKRLHDKFLHKGQVIPTVPKEATVNSVNGGGTGAGNGNYGVTGEGGKAQSGGTKNNNREFKEMKQTKY